MYQNIPDDLKKLTGENEQEEEISDLDDLLRKAREMEKQRKEAAPSEAEVSHIP